MMPESQPLEVLISFVWAEAWPLILFKKTLDDTNV